MGQDKPTEFPDWATDPPASPPTTLTTPDAGMQEDGWQPEGGWNNGRLVRQILNWLQNKSGQWVRWFNQTTHRTSDLHPDHALPSGTAPSGATTTGSAAEFTGRVYVGGYEVPLTDSPAHTYTDNEDTHWDLGRSATWTAAEGASPALTANSVRVYSERVTAGVRTRLADYRRTMLDALRMRWGYDLLGSDANAALSRQATPFRPSGTAYVLVHDHSPKTGATKGVRVYLDETRKELCVLEGVSWNGTAWAPDSGVFVAERKSLSASYSARTLIIASSTPFADSVWFDDMADAGALAKTDAHDGTIEAGSDLTNNDFEVGEVPRFKANAVSAGGSVPTMAHDVGSGADYALTLASQGTDGVGPAREWTVNCKRLKVAGVKKFRRISSGDAWKVELSSDSGFRIYRHPAGEASPWTDTLALSAWTRVFYAAPDGSIVGQANALRRVTLSATAAMLKVPTEWAVDINTPHTNASGNVSHAGGSATGLAVPLNLPHGAIVTGARWFGTADSVNQVRAWIEVLDPTDLSSGASMTVAGHTAFANVSVLPTANEMDIDASDAVRTIDRSKIYILFVFATASAECTFFAAQVDYTANSVNQ